MYSTDDKGSLEFMGSIFLFIVSLLAIAKALQVVFEELTLAAAKAGKFLDASIPFVATGLQVASLVALIVTVTVGGGYFLWRYIRAVRSLTDNRNFLAEELDQLKSEYSGFRKEMVSWTERELGLHRSDIRVLAERLNDAAKKSEDFMKLNQAKPQLTSSSVELPSTNPY